MNTSKPTRRTFIKQAGLAIGMPMIVPSSVLGLNGKTAPSNRIVMGGIGLGPRGRKVLTAFFAHKDCQFIAIGDPQAERSEIIKRMADKNYGNKDCVKYPDMTGILERDDLDAVIIATGDRWHATASIYAARAGKDIYCEKPCAMNIQECQELDDEIQKHGRVFQAGTQRRSVPNFIHAVNLARSGRLGKLKEVHAGILELQEYLDDLPEEPMPDPSVINWDKWVGPAPMKPFNKKYCVNSRWRNHSGFYSAWRLPEWGSHTIDLCQWAADADGTTPVEYETLSDGEIHAKYANGVKLIMRLSGKKAVGDWIEGLGSCPVKFVGDEGWVEVGDFAKIEASDPSLLDNKTYELAGTDPVNHTRNFLDCVKSRKQPVCNSKAVRYGHMACFAAAISWKLGRKVKFDPVKESFVNDAEANSMRTYKRRGPYTI